MLIYDVIVRYLGIRADEYRCLTIVICNILLEAGTFVDAGFHDGKKRRALNNNIEKAVDGICTSARTLLIESQPLADDQTSNPLLLHRACASKADCTRRALALIWPLYAAHVATEMGLCRRSCIEEMLFALGERFKIPLAFSMVLKSLPLSSEPVSDVMKGNEWVITRHAKMVRYHHWVDFGRSGGCVGGSLSLTLTDARVSVGLCCEFMEFVQDVVQF